MVNAYRRTARTCSCEISVIVLQGEGSLTTPVACTSRFCVSVPYYDSVATGIFRYVHLGRESPHGEEAPMRAVTNTTEVSDRLYCGTQRSPGTSFLLAFPPCAFPAKIRGRATTNSCRCREPSTWWTLKARCKRNTPLGENETSYWCRHPRPIPTTRSIGHRLGKRSRRYACVSTLSWSALHRRPSTPS